MNLIWIITVIISTVFIIFSKGSVDFTSVMSDSAKSSIELLISLAGIMALWGGIMQIAEQSGITNIFSKIMQPVISLLFPKLKNENKAKDAVAMNMTANLLGLGNAATPLGIEAMKRLKKISGEGDTATNEMITFVVLNTASIQLIPTTTAVLRAEYGSKNPMSIMFPVLFASVSSLIVGLIFDRVLRGKFNA